MQPGSQTHSPNTTGINTDISAVPFISQQSALLQCVVSFNPLEADEHGLLVRSVPYWQTGWGSAGVLVNHTFNCCPDCRLALNYPVPKTLAKGAVNRKRSQRLWIVVVIALVLPHKTVHVLKSP